MSAQAPEVVVPIHNVGSFSFTPAPVAGISPEAVRSGIFVYGNVVLPPNPSNVDLMVKAVNSITFNVSIPRVVLLQARQSENNDLGFPDQFALQVIETSQDFIRFRIRRIDGGSASPLGWGQDLRIDILVIDDGTEG